MLGICDANYNFLFVDIGASGRRSDGGIFKDSNIGKKFVNGAMNLPPPKQLMADGNSLPYVLVGNEAFELTNYLMRPYPGRNLVNSDRRIYNYRLSRARRTIENTFGILVSRWRVLKKPLECTPRNAIHIVKAITCLHNWLRKNNEVDYLPTVIEDEILQKEVDESALNNAILYSNRGSTHMAMDIRDEFCTYFNHESAVPWQYNSN